MKRMTAADFMYCTLFSTTVVTLLTELSFETPKLLSPAISTRSMVKRRTILSSFPNTPLPVSTLDDLEQHDGIKMVSPLMMRSGPDPDTDIVDRFMLQTTSKAYVLMYSPREGWIAEIELTTDDMTGQEVFEELTVQAQAPQAGLLDEMEEADVEYTELKVDADDLDE